MKILLVNNNFFLRGGAERAFFDMNKILENKGHEVAHFSTKTDKDYDSPWKKYFVEYNELNDSSKFTVLQKMRIVSRIWYNFETKRKLRALLEEFRPDVAHLHNIFHHLSPSVIDELKKQKIPVVWTLHDYKIISPNYDLSVRGHIWEAHKGGKMHKCVTERCVHNSYSKSLVCVVEAYLHRILGSFKKVDAFISPSDFLIEKHREFGFDAEMEKVVNPVHVKDYTEVEPWKLGIGNCSRGYILFFGRLSAEKGVRDLIEAYAKVETNLPLIIAGDGPERENLSFVARQAGVGDRVRFVGKLEKNELFTLIKNSSFVVSPSRCYENAPYGILEAMGLGKMVIAPDVGGSGEIIKSSGEGLLFEMGNVEDLAQKIQTALTHPDEVAEIGLRSKSFVEEKYNQELFYEKISKIYKRVVG